MDLCIYYPRHIVWFRPFEVIDRSKVHGVEVAAHVQRPGND